MLLEECPVRVTLDIIGGKWKPIILYFLMDGEKRHGVLRKLIPQATQKVLTQQLRELEADGIIARKVFPASVTKVEYSLTEFGWTLKPVIQELCTWGRTQMDNAGQAPSSCSAPAGAA